MDLDVGVRAVAVEAGGGDPRRSSGDADHIHTNGVEFFRIC